MPKCMMEQHLDKTPYQRASLVITELQIQKDKPIILEKLEVTEKGNLFLNCLGKSFGEHTELYIELGK